MPNSVDGLTSRMVAFARRAANACVPVQTRSCGEDVETQEGALGREGVPRASCAAPAARARRGRAARGCMRVNDTGEWRG